MSVAGEAVVEEVRKKRSVLGAHWDVLAEDVRFTQSVVQRFGVHAMLARLLGVRGIALAEVEDFLRPSLRQLLPDPFHLLDMQKAADRLADAVEQGEVIAVFGDYDVDGATSSALLTRFFRALGCDEVLVYIPDRIVEGYGPNSKALLGLKEQGASVCVTVDCGTHSFEPLAAAAKAGLDMIVIDHHLGGEELPEAVAVVNPNRLDECSDCGHLAAVGMAFLLVVAVRSVLKKRGFFDAGKQEPDLMALLDLVALGTVCDVVALEGINRAFVAQGLKVLRKRRNLGLAGLVDVAGVDTALRATHLGFLLGPRINAGGRVGEAGLGTTLLASEDSQEVAAIAKQLDHYNKERQAVEAMVLEEAIAYVEARDTTAPVLVAVGKGWHPGVIGIVAGRLKDRYHRPVAVIAVADGVGKASARSIKGVDFGSAVIVAKMDGLLVAGGGHAMAAGFTVEEGEIDALEAFFKARFGDAVAAHGKRRLVLDGCVALSGVTASLVEAVAALEPFGQGNPEPRFMVEDAIVVKADVVGKDHLRVILKDGLSESSKTVTAMVFRSVGTPLGDALLASRGKVIDVAGKVRVNVWQGRETVQLLVDDIAV